MVSWLVGWFGSDQAGSCVLTQSVNPSQVESGWVGWLVGWLAGWLAGWFGSDQAGSCGLTQSVNLSQVDLVRLLVLNLHNTHTTLIGDPG